MASTSPKQATRYVRYVIALKIRVASFAVGRRAGMIPFFERRVVMIIGLISDFARQKSVLPMAVVRMLEAIQKVDPLKMEPGKYEVEGDKLFFLVRMSQSCARWPKAAPAHKQYADIQLPYSTPERYGFALPQPELLIADDQLKEKDLAFFPTPAAEAFIDVNPGTYLVFLPNELHRPASSSVKRKRSARSS